MDMRKRIVSGKLFLDTCQGLTEERLLAKARMQEFNQTNPEDRELRYALSREIFGQQTKAYIEPPFYFSYGRNIQLGEDCYINFNCNFLDDGKIVIGNRVMFGPAVTIATVGHPIHPEYREFMYTDPVVIEDNCWIGTNTTICPGVTIGRNTVIGAGSVVTKDIPKNSVAAGNPCRVIRNIGTEDYSNYRRGKELVPSELEQVRQVNSET